MRKVLCALLLCCASLGAFADTYTLSNGTAYVGQNRAYSTVTAPQLTVGRACGATIDYLNAADHSGTFSLASCSYPYVNYKKVSIPSGVVSNDYFYVQPSGSSTCASGKYVDDQTGACVVSPPPPPPPPVTCPSGYVNASANDQSCVPAPLPACPAGQSLQMGVCLQNPCPAGQLQVPQLVVTPTGSHWGLSCEATGAGTGLPTPTSKLCPDGQSASATGECLVAQPANPVTTPNLCPAGYVNMSSDAANPLCAKAPTKDASVSTTTNADGSTTTTTTTKFTQQNPDGTTSESTRTDVTNKAADGTSTTSSTTSQKQNESNPDPSDICKTNPNLTICKTSSVSGDCAATSFTGDAITGAILQKVRQEYCENTTDNDTSLLGKSIVAGSDPQAGAAAAALAGSTVDLSSQSLDQSGFLSSSACIGNRSINVAGRTIAVNFSAVCEDILPLRYAVLAASLIAAYLLVSKSVLQGG